MPSSLKDLVVVDATERSRELDMHRALSRSAVRAEEYLSAIGSISDALELTASVRIDLRPPLADAQLALALWA